LRLAREDGVWVKNEGNSLKTGFAETSASYHLTDRTCRKPDFQGTWSGAESMNSQNTWLVCVLGVAVFARGGFARHSRVVHLFGWGGYLSSQRDLTEKYRALVRSQHAPSWPIGVSFVCIPLGIVIAFGAIFFSK